MFDNQNLQFDPKILDAEISIKVRDFLMMFSSLNPMSGNLVSTQVYEESKISYPKNQNEEIDNFEESNTNQFPTDLLDIPITDFEIEGSPPENE